MLFHDDLLNKLSNAYDKLDSQIILNLFQDLMMKNYKFKDFVDSNDQLDVENYWIHYVKATDKKYMKN